MKNPRMITVLLTAALIVFYFSTTRPKSRATPSRNFTPVGGRIEKTDDEWRAVLSPEVYKVTRQKGTERAFCGEFWNAKGDGVYECVCCGQPLFDSTAKFDSASGWPSFLKPAAEEALSLFQDKRVPGMPTEVLCSRCDAHLGHVFHDGPPPRGLRYCLNSVALNFVPRADGSH
jgi:peptide-methionine (R)-S-oxide reductase